MQPRPEVTGSVCATHASAWHVSIPTVAEAFVQERITTSHANLIARLPQEHQAAGFENCWRKDWKDEEAHLLPAKHLSAWIQANLYLNLAEAPFDREDALLKPEAGACVTCPRRSGQNTSLYHDEQGEGEPVLLLPGWPESWYAWRAVMKELAASGVRFTRLILEATEIVESLRRATISALLQKIFTPSSPLPDLPGLKESMS